MNLLFIAYHFPPIGGSGVQRSAKFVRYLPDYGVNPIVVSGPAVNVDRWAPEDTTQVTELPESLPVYRPSVATPPPTKHPRWVRLTATAEERERWWQRQIRDLGARAAREHQLDAIYVSLLPYEGLAAAVDLGRSLDLPVIADLRDPWVLDEVRLYPTIAHRLLEQRLMGRLLADCALVIGNTPEATAAIAEAFPAVSKRNLTTITNGYDASDFIGIDTRPHDGRFRIVHTGYLHSSIAMVHRRNLATKRFLGGSLWPIDLLCRSHYYLLKGVSILEKEDPELASRIDIILAGVLSEQDEQIIRESPAGSRVRTLGYISHREAIQEMMLADALFLPMHSVPPGRRARIVPGKTYEYLASGRPILAAVPQGDAQDFIVEARAGLITDPSDARMIARGIRALSSGSVGARPIGDGVERFERRHLTQDLAERLTEL